MKKITLEELKRIVESSEPNNYVTVSVDVAWDIDIDDDNIVDEYGAPSHIYIKIPKDVWENKSIDLDISGKLEDLYGYCVDDFIINQVNVPESGVKVLYWTDDGLKGSP